jgi:hypothetical protein
MPKGSMCFGSHATRIAINRSVAAGNSGDVSGTLKHSQYESAVVERLEDDQTNQFTLRVAAQRTVAYALKGAGLAWVCWP